MKINRRAFVQGMPLAATSALVLGEATGLAQQAERNTSKRKRRTVYFNDARHYYLYVFEPPMALADAWRPIDEVAGTAVDTFIYGVERGDGLFYPSKVGMRFGYDMRPFDLNAFWRVWHNMQSLIDRGLDPLAVLIDRAHAKGMEFFASLRMASYGGIDPKLTVPKGGRGLAHQEVRDHQFAVLEELATRYNVEGVELDFAAGPSGMPLVLRKEDAPAFTPVITDYVRKISKMVRGRSGKPGQIGARVYPLEQMCLNHGLDVRTWLKEGLIDYLAPMLYADFNVNPDLPIEWLVQEAHAANVPVYGVLQPYAGDEQSGTSLNAPKRIHLTPEIMRAAAANFWALGVDGLYAWFLRWPLGSAERQLLTELADPDLIKEGNKQYVLRRATKEAVEMGYDAALPLKIPSADASKRYPIPFHIADDTSGASGRIRQVTLRLQIDNLVSADHLTILLNGKSLAGETCLRDYGDRVAAYQGQWLEFHLQAVRPQKGKNILEISLDKRPANLTAGISVEHVEVLVEYGPYPSRLNA
ncbi:MAG: hypothetical protein EXQ58_07090 [Acidobacteria bacterium]|nr:hypothetical protein [Acidobacteriota bacterium]